MANTVWETIQNQPGIWKVRMDKYRSTWNYFTTYPQGGGFGSNHCGPKYIALARAIQNIPIGRQYQLEINGKDKGIFTKGETK